MGIGNWITWLCLIAEGAASDWAGILLRDDMGYEQGR